MKCYDGDIDRLVGELEARKLNVVKWTIGCESGVPFYDRVCNHLNLEYSNDFSKTAHRRNKFLMQEQIKGDGNRGIYHKMIQSKQEAVDWINEVKIGFPLIVKPVDSAGTEGVSFCATLGDVEHAIDRFLGEKNIFGIENKFMLVQEYLKGTE